MKILKNSLVLLILTLGYTAYGQDNCSYKQMIAKIDSISKARNIEMGVVKFQRITSNVEGTYTEGFGLTKKQKFVFDGQFLVFGNTYFNMDKLLFFYIKEDYFDFYFQGY